MWWNMKYIPYSLAYWLAYMGKWIIEHPNKVLYAMILLLCLMLPYTGFFFVLLLLSWAYWSQRGV